MPSDLFVTFFSVNTTVISLLTYNYNNMYLEKFEDTKRGNQKP